MQFDDYATPEILELGAAEDLTLSDPTGKVDDDCTCKMCDDPCGALLGVRGIDSIPQFEL